MKNQKLESLCRALQEERKSQHENVQGVQPDRNTSEDSAKAETEVQEAPIEPKEENPAQNATPPASAGEPTPLTQKLAQLKAEQAFLKELAGSFTISNVAASETEAKLSHGLPAVSQEKHTERSHQDQLQEQKEKEMESVD